MDHMDRMDRMDVTDTSRSPEADLSQAQAQAQAQASTMCWAHLQVLVPGGARRARVPREVLVAARALSPDTATDVQAVVAGLTVCLRSVLASVATAQTEEFLAFAAGELLLGLQRRCFTPTVDLACATLDVLVRVRHQPALGAACTHAPVAEGLQQLQGFLIGLQCDGDTVHVMVAHLLNVAACACCHLGKPEKNRQACGGRVAAWATVRPTTAGHLLAMVNTCRVHLSPPSPVVAVACLRLLACTAMQFGVEHLVPWVPWMRQVVGMCAARAARDDLAEGAMAAGLHTLGVVVHANLLPRHEGVTCAHVAGDAADWMAKLSGPPCFRGRLCVMTLWWYTLQQDQDLGAVAEFLHEQHMPWLLDTMHQALARNCTDEEDRVPHRGECLQLAAALLARVAAPGDMGILESLRAMVQDQCVPMSDRVLACVRRVHCVVTGSAVAPTDVALQPLAAL